MDGENGWRLVPRLAGGVVAVPMVVAFVALGAAVVVARSVRDVARETWGRLSSRRSGAASGGGVEDDGSDGEDFDRRDRRSR